MGNSYMFTGREYDSETGLYYYRARYYNPQIGRFISRDPIGYVDSMSLYTYVKNNPIMHVDPSGLMVMIPWGFEFGSSINCASLVWNIIKIIHWYNRYNDPRGVTNGDFAHCYMSCRLSQDCRGGAASAWSLGWAKELNDIYIRHEPIEDSYKDMAANQSGQNCANKGDDGGECPGATPPPQQQCASCCQKKYGDPGGMKLP
jgi:RHS repeat-associated protein